VDQGQAGGPCFDHPNAFGQGALGQTLRYPHPKAVVTPQRISNSGDQNFHGLQSP
jgi:hypothetical protein